MAWSDAAKTAAQVARQLHAAGGSPVGVDAQPDYKQKDIQYHQLYGPGSQAQYSGSRDTLGGAWERKAGNINLNK